MAAEGNYEHWEMYKSMLVATSSLLNNQFLADIQFQLGDEIIYAHSHELSKRSKVFALQHQGTIGVMKLITIRNHSYIDFYEFLKYIYTDDCNINKNNVYELLKLALRYEINSLTTSIRKFLMESMACDNVLKLYEFCLVENFMPQISKISIFISENFYVLIKSKEFLDISLLTLIELLKFDKIDSVTREIDICMAVMRWVNNYLAKNELLQTGTSKREILINALKYIRFPVMSKLEFSRFVSTENDLLTVTEINSIFISMSLPERNTYHFITYPRTFYIDYSAGPDINLNMIPYFGLETKSPPFETTSRFTINKNMIITSIIIGVGLVPQAVEVKLLNQTKNVLRHMKAEYDREKWKSGSVQVVFDLPFLLRASSTYTISLNYSQPSCLVTGIVEKKLLKTHSVFNKLEIKFNEISPFLLQMNFKEFK